MTAFDGAPVSWDFSIEGEGVEFRVRVKALDARDALSRGLSHQMPNGAFAGSLFSVPVDAIAQAPANFDTQFAGTAGAYTYRVGLAPSERMVHRGTGDSRLRGRHLRDEHVTDLDGWEASHPGQLQWIELVHESPGRRIDKMTYCLDGVTEFLLCVDDRHSTRITYFAEDFTAQEAIGFLQSAELEFVERLREMRGAGDGGDFLLRVERPRA